MTPDMSVPAMLDRFIYVVKGSRIIDRTATDWGRWHLCNDNYVKHMVYSLSDLKRYFSHRRTRFEDPFDKWFKHKDRFTAPNLVEAMRLADLASKGFVEPRIDVDQILWNARLRRDAPDWVRGVHARRADAASPRKSNHAPVT